MYIPFTEMPSTSRIWIYQSSKAFTDSEAEELRTLLKAFVEQWTAHKLMLNASFELRYNRFVILAVDEDVNDASGCSIDASVRFIKDLEMRFSTNFFDRMQFAYLKNGNVEVLPRPAFENEYSSGAINDQTIVFNNLTATKADFDANWQSTLAASWHKQLLS